VNIYIRSQVQRLESNTEFDDLETKKLEQTDVDQGVTKEGTP
jgi:hypothetical protein